MPRDDWLPLPERPSKCGLPPDLMHRSLSQNSLLYSSEGLTLIALDHLYSFKTALQTFARTQSACRLEEAVDELRRLVLANGRRTILKSELVSRYTWLDRINDKALNEVDRVYIRAYGDGGTVNDVDPSWPLPNNGPLTSIHSTIDETLTSSAAMIQAKRGAEMQMMEAAAAATLRRERRRALSYMGLEFPEEKEFLGLETIDVGDVTAEWGFDEIEKWYKEVDVALNDSLVAEIETALDTTMTKLTIDPTASTRTDADHNASGEVDEAGVSPLDESDEELEEMRRTTPKLLPPPASRVPALKVQTTFQKRSKRPLPTPTSISTGDAGGSHSSRSNNTTPEFASTLTAPTEPSETGQSSKSGAVLLRPISPDADDDMDDVDDDDELTARPKSAVPVPATRWDSMFSIDSVLNPRAQKSPVDAPADPSLSRLSHGSQVIPMTPSACDDLSPITMGEWGFLMFAKSAKIVAVETC
jgi:hypothetical protein